MEVKARFCNRTGVAAVCVLIGILGAAVLYYGIFLLLALVNYFDGFYKHDTFYALYPTAASYLVAFFSTGTLKHLPGYEIELNVGIPLLFCCGMVFLGLLLVILLRKNALEISGEHIRGKGILQKPFDLPISRIRAVKKRPFGGLLLATGEKRSLFFCIKNRAQLLEALADVPAKQG